jgi:radical SAM/Cys-rich protein
MSATDKTASEKFIKTIGEIERLPLCSTGIDTLQVNLGYRCNLSCKHCHVQAGPMRTEIMAKADIESVVHALDDSPIDTLDLTGGAPELHPEFRFLVSTARAIGCNVIVRSNLAVFFEQGLEDLPVFYSENGVEVIASLPYFQASNMDGVRGDGVFEKCINALKLLNDFGYGHLDSELKVHLVYNPRGAFLPPSQDSLEKQYRKELLEKHDVHFNRLYALANMPLGRFKNFLLRSGNYGQYLDKLQDAFNPDTLDGIMCKRLVSVGWDGMLSDCDFNQIAGLKVSNCCPAHIRNFKYDTLCQREIVLSDHCFGCTAGQGST